jgi:hypothetical protein
MPQGMGQRQGEVEVGRRQPVAFKRRSFAPQIRQLSRSDKAAKKS